MKTLVVSDLHLGARTRSDLLRRPELREPLLRALEDVDRLVLLGDVVELRQGPAWEALEHARPALQDIGRAMAGREVVLVAGNHDHRIASAWLDERRETGRPSPLALDERYELERAGSVAGRIIEWLAPARVELRYPGFWIRDDVWATHGHYLDRHTTVPAYERIGAAIVERFSRTLPERHCTPDDYEAVLAPIYALLYEAAQNIVTDGPARQGGASVRMWRNLQGGKGSRRPPRYALLAAALPLTIAALNRAGLGPLRSELSGVEVRRAAIGAMGEVLRRLEVQPAWVVFGHIHRAGPFERDAASDWRLPSGTRLVNSGSWVYEPTFLTDEPYDSPYWPGIAVEVPATGPPRLLKLLGLRNHTDLKP